MRHLFYPDETYLNRKPIYDAEGNSICINCGKPLPKQRWLYCSSKCNMEFYKNHVKDWGLIREQVFKRDKYTCQRCGLKLSSSELQCDHIIPISLGGPEFDMRNLQTLCEDCHKKKTARDRGKLGKVVADIQRGLQQILNVSEEAQHCNGIEQAERGE